MQIFKIKVADLSADPANARKHDDQNIDSIVASLRRFGQQKPIVIDASNVVRAGNGTLEAAKRLGWDSIECVKTDLKGSDAIAYAIADNRTAELAEWDSDILAAQLSGLLTDDEALANAAGFSTEEIEAMLSDLADPTVIDEDEVPEPPVDPITKLGDLWILGEHRVLCGDSTKAEDVERLMAGAKARYGMFDPPYGIAVIGGVSKAKGSIGGVSKAKANTYEPIHGDDKPFDPTPFFGIAEQSVWWGANYYADKLPSRKGWIVWDKKGREWNDNFSDCEMAWTPFETVARIYRHVWMGLVQEGEREIRQHPTQKPVALFAKLMRELFKDDGVILDLWLGSGTTLIAAEQLGRKCYGMEISPQYCDVIVARWEKLTGQKAICQSAIPE
jgi:DNA modification methylase